MGSKKLQVWLPLLFAVVMIVGIMIGFQLKEKTMSPRFFSFSQRSSLQELTELIKNRYVDKVQADSINELVSNQLLQHLDPHSVFIPSNDLAAVNEDMMGNFQGIGIEFRQIRDTVHVMNIIAGGPAEKAGLQIGDQLLFVGDTIGITGKEVDIIKIRKLFRGSVGSKVKVRFKRGAVIKEVLITRDVILVSSIDAAYMPSPGVGYIRINKFAERTYEEFMQQLEKLQAAKMESLIIDLRGNGGGLMKEAVDIADEFLSDDKLIVYTEGEHTPRMDYRAKRPGLFEKGKLVVLIDETSASASEVLAGALQDWERATIIGRRSFGKGLVQQQFQLSSGAAVRLTVARYYTPLGRNIQKPYEAGIGKYKEELMARFHPTDSTKKLDSILLLTAKVYKTASGKRVYGGGGITPDSTVLFDSSLFKRASVVQILMSAGLSDYAYQVYLSNKSYFATFKTPESFNALYQPDEMVWSGFIRFLAKEGILLDKIDLSSKIFISNRLKAMISRQIWRSNGYFIVANEADQTFKKALKTIK
ncbi:MAG: S41 family peptidase [Sphingobacteriia bacterium]|nr:MAG: S41 family peptidase [Sphingobacteriia bacterium]TAG31056.1 MAG: S41 family peptidase [Sphingobacteriia bacterium]TAH08356.1 MAG: S41 family peptidase [Sphingobacteriia bacterium]